MSMGPAEIEADTDRSGRRREGLAFFLLLMVLMPALAIAVVGGYGLAVWLFQTFTGPPS